jgi:FAD/FMN-containing dehydrogenase
MKGIRVDPAARTAGVEAGCTWGDVDHATHAFGLATVSGIISTTGVGGLTLGGGHGHLTRKYGLTIDNLLAADVVLADGRLVTASADEHADLFWALRGGGGNFGVVTAFLFQLHPVDTVYAGPIFWPLDDAAEALRFYQGFITEAPEEMSAFFAFMKVPPAPPFPEELHGQTVCGVVCCYAGPQAQAEAVTAPLRQFGPPLFEHLGPMPYPKLQGAFDALYPPGLQWYWKGDFINELSDEAIALHVQYGSHIPTPHSTMHLYPINGAPHRVGRHDTAFSYRDATWSEVIVGVDPDPANNDQIITWTREYWDAVHPYSAGGAYVNFMMDEGDEGIERIQATYRDNYARLVEIKTKYDPHNRLRVNQNIKPVT